MAQVAKEIGKILESPYVTNYNWLQRYALLRSHPRKLYFDMAVMVNIDDNTKMTKQSRL